MQQTVDYQNGTVTLIDQNRIPAELVMVELTSLEQVADAIRTMKVRGAPAIGVTAALGVALAARRASGSDPTELLEVVAHAAGVLKNTRPTAVNLFWAIDRMIETAHHAAARASGADDIRDALDQQAALMIQEDQRICRAIGRSGAVLMPDEGHVLTHCNAGALACVSYGTALGVIRAAVEDGKRLHVFADETRPRLQGMKLTCFELAADDIPVTVIADNMAGSLMRAGKIDCVIVGADRIASNGDVANKIGTYSLAVLAHHHGIPMYVAAPISTVDFSVHSGDDIPIEERSHEEMLTFGGRRIAPMGVDTINPSFDVTPAALVTAIVTEEGVVRAPYKQTLRRRRD